MSSASHSSVDESGSASDSNGNEAASEADGSGSISVHGERKLDESVSDESSKPDEKIDYTEPKANSEDDAEVGSDELSESDGFKLAQASESDDDDDSGAADVESESEDALYCPSLANQAAYDAKRAKKRAKSGQPAKRKRRKPMRLRAADYTNEEVHKSEVKQLKEAVDLKETEAEDGDKGKVGLAKALHQMVFDGYDKNAHQWMQDHIWSRLMFGGRDGNRMTLASLAADGGVRIRPFRYSGVRSVCAMCQSTKACFGYIKTDAAFALEDHARVQADVANEVTADAIKRKRDVADARNYASVGIDCATRFMIYEKAGKIWRALCYKAIYYRQRATGTHGDADLKKRVEADLAAIAERLDKIEISAAHLYDFERTDMKAWKRLADHYKNANNKNPALVL